MTNINGAVTEKELADILYDALIVYDMVNSGAEYPEELDPESNHGRTAAFIAERLGFTHDVRPLSYGLVSDIDSAVHDVVDAWVDPGNMPAYHFNEMNRLRKRWPSLHRSVSRLVKAYVAGRNPR